MSSTIKLTFKDLKQQKFTIDASPSDTILEVKQKIAEEKGWDASLQKLIYSGKILQDANTVESYNIEEKGFIVCMLAKAKPPAAGSSSTGTTTPATPIKPQTQTQTPAAPSQASRSGPTVPETPTPAANTSSTTTAASTETPAQPATFNDPNALALGSARESAIANILEMGFERAQVEEAMRAAFNNPDRAVEYLMTGIPENLSRENRTRDAGATAPSADTTQPAAATEDAPQTEGATTQAGGDDDDNVNLFEAAANAQRTQPRATPAGGAAGTAAAAAARDNLDFLRNNPQFQQLRQVVQQNPQMLEPILQQVGAGNPQLAQMISQNPHEFLRLLGENVDEEDFEGEGGEGGGGVPPGAMQIQVTEEERAAIERLCMLGFDRNSVIQAYFACDKNEEMAANFLFENPDNEG